MTKALSSLAVVLVTLGWATSQDDAAPERSGSYVIQEPKIEGTTWKVEGDHETCIVCFETGGVLCYTSGNWRFRLGTWKQDGGSIVFDRERHFADYYGKICDGRIVGKGTNRNGDHWIWHANPAGRILIERFDEIPQQDK